MRIALLVALVLALAVAPVAAPAPCPRSRLDAPLPARCTTPGDLVHAAPAESPPHDSLPRWLLPAVAVGVVGVLALAVRRS
jgi:hypothetical protein